MHDVIEGREGWLFLRSDGTNTPLADACDLKGWTDRVLPRLVARMKGRAARLAARRAGRGIPFVVLLTPECSSIYPEYLPPGVVPDTPCAAEIAAAALCGAGLNVVCPSDALRAAKPHAAMFLKTDTHWTHRGAYLAYEMLMDALCPVAALPRHEIRFGERQGFGDLGVWMQPERRGTLTAAAVPGRDVRVLRSVNDQLLYSLRHTACGQGEGAGRGRLLMFRDSAGNALMPFLEATFAETIMMSPSPAMPDEAIDVFDPDYVVLQVSEAGLFRAEPDFADWDPRGMANVYDDLGATPGAARWRAEALDALREGDGARAVAPACVAAVLAPDAAKADIGTLAWALLNAGQYAACAAMTERFAPLRQDAFLHYLNAQAAIHLGRADIARAALGQAIILRPGHAQFLYSLGEFEFRAGNFATSLAAMRQSMKGEPGYARSWSVAISCARLLGDLEQASVLHAQAEAIFGIDVLQEAA